MDLLNECNKFHNQSFVSSFLVNSLPKGGTNLLSKAVASFPGIRFSKIHIDKKTVAPLQQIAAPESTEIPVGVDCPSPIQLNTVQQSLQKLQNGYYATVHFPFSEPLAGLLAQMRINSLLILRDPRDVVISHANYVASNSNHFLFSFYQPLSQSERIMKSITGIEKATPDGLRLLNIRDRCQSVITWSSQPFNYTTYFEKLVGARGGGCYDTQLKEIENIAQHLKIRCNFQDIEGIAQQLFGGTSTFRKGTIGGWQKHFSVEHKTAFKELAGEILIDLGYEKNFDW